MRRCTAAAASATTAALMRRPCPTSNTATPSRSPFPRYLRSSSSLNSENKKETAAPRVVIEGVRPQVDCGRYPVKRAVGDDVTVEADVFTDGHDAVVAEVLWRRVGAGDWHVVPMAFLGNDHWTASFQVEELGRYEYTVRGWADPFLTWQRDLRKRQEAGQDLSVDFLIGGALSCNPILKDAARPAAERYATAMALKPPPPDDSEVVVYDKTLQVIVDPVRARFSTWYELFPRSARGDGTHATLRDLIAFLPAVEAMGFDVLYLPPVHPIGMTERKGKHNALKA